MSLNKQKIIPLIESYYHTFTPLERTIADFFIIIQKRKIFLPDISPESSMYQKRLFHALPRNVVSMDTENLFMNISRVLSLKQRKTFQTSRFQNLILIRNFLIRLMPCWIKPRLHISPDFWFPNHGCMSMEEAVPGLWLRK